jgi:hypothetical protein
MTRSPSTTLIRLAAPNQNELVVHVVTRFDDQAALARQPSIRRGRCRSFFILPVSRKELAFS